MSENASGTRRCTDITPGPGGVMTDEVGVVTGPLTLCSEVAPAGGVGGAGKETGGHAVKLRVQYKDADEWYTVTGGGCTLADAADLDAVHAIAVGLLNRPSG